MSETFTPALTTTNWNEEWKRLQEAREHAEDAAYWDEKAKTFPVKHGSQYGYVSDFLRLADIREGETVLDMGCGTGALATPLAQAGHRVVACDFSQGMMNVMLADQKELGVSSVDARIMSWTDDWDAHGLSENCVDVALASRSIATNDLKDSLMKLDRAAKRRCCITLPFGASPKTDSELLAAAGFSHGVGRDFLYAFNILASCGIMPEVSYIPNTRFEEFETFDDALDYYIDIVQHAVKATADENDIAAIPHRLRTWLETKLVHDDRGYHLEKERRVTWAFIAWTK